jgi:hypothetical protein
MMGAAGQHGQRADLQAAAAVTVTVGTRIDGLAPLEESLETEPPDPLELLETMELLGPGAFEVSDAPLDVVPVLEAEPTPAGALTATTPMALAAELPLDDVEPPHPASVAAMSSGPNVRNRSP